MSNNMSVIIYHFNHNKAPKGMFDLANHLLLSLTFVSRSNFSIVFKTLSDRNIIGFLSLKNKKIDWGGLQAS